MPNPEMGWLDKIKNVHFGGGNWISINWTGNFPGESPVSVQVGTGAKARTFSLPSAPSGAPPGFITSPAIITISEFNAGLFNRFDHFEAGGLFAVTTTFFKTSAFPDKFPVTFTYSGLFGASSVCGVYPSSQFKSTGVLDTDLNASDFHDKSIGTGPGQPHQAHYLVDQKALTVTLLDP
jgi:hypothetical protein